MAMDPSSTFTFQELIEETWSSDLRSLGIPRHGHFEFPLNPPGHPDHQSGPFWDPCNGSLDDAATSFQVGYFGLPGEGCSDPGLLENYKGSQNAVLGDDPMPASSFSAPASCANAGCQVLRDITHTKGMHVKRLQIHGRLDSAVFTHAILEECDSKLSPIEHQFQLADYEQEKNFLAEYLETCGQKGYEKKRDPLSNFYETLSIGLNGRRSSPEKTGGSNQGPGFIKKYSPKEQVSRIMVFQ